LQYFHSPFDGVCFRRLVSFRRAAANVSTATVWRFRRHAGGFSASTVERLKDAWSEEHARWGKRDLSTKRYVYFWADGIHVQARLEDAAQCLWSSSAPRPRARRSWSA
jgi:putative transposase